MGSYNRAVVMGNTGKDPVLRDIGGGNRAAQFSVATTENVKDNEGEWHQRTEWHNVVAFGKLADAVEKHVRKGTSVLVEGKLRTRVWVDQHGNRRNSTEIVAEAVRLAGIQPKSEPAAMTETAEDPTGDLPF